MRVVRDLVGSHLKPFVQDALEHTVTLLLCCTNITKPSLKETKSKVLSLYFSSNRAGILVVPDNGTHSSNRIVFVGGPTTLQELTQGQLTALVKLAYRCNVKDLGKHQKARFYDGVRWAHTGRKFTILIHSMVLCDDSR